MQVEPVLAAALAEYQAGQRDRLRAMVTDLTERGLSALRPASSKTAKNTLPPDQGHRFRAGVLSGKTEPVRSPDTVRDGATCKTRPDHNRPKGRGGGGKRRWVPWCS